MKQRRLSQHEFDELLKWQRNRNVSTTDTLKSEAAKANEQFHFKGVKITASHIRRCWTTLMYMELQRRAGWRCGGPFPDYLKG